MKHYLYINGRNEEKLASTTLDKITKQYITKFTRN